MTMTQFEIEQALVAMRGKSFRYKNEVHQFLRYRIGPQVKITTDREDIVIMIEDFPGVIQSFHEVSPPESMPAVGGAGLQHQTVINSSGLELKNTLMDSIRELKRNKDYVAQASAINDTVKTIIDLAKVEVEMIKVMKQR